MALTENKTDFEEAMRLAITSMQANTDGTYNEIISLSATIWVSLLLAAYKGNHSLVSQEMQNTVATIIHGFSKGEFGVSAARLH